MTKDELRAKVVDLMGRIAPDEDLGALDPETNIREALDIDSMDFLNFVIALRDELGVSIAESEYPKISTLRGCVECLASRLGID